MRIFLALLVCVFPLMSFGQGLKLTPMTTNLTMNQPVSGGSPIWNATANRWSNGVVVAAATNAIGNSLGLGTNTSFYGAVTNNGTLRQVGAMEARAAVTATNGAIVLGNAGLDIKFGLTPDNSGTFSNHFGTYQIGQWIMNVAGQSAHVLDGAFFGAENGSYLNIGANPAYGTTASKIQFGTNDYIVSLGTTDNSETQRYRFYNDNSGNDTNKVQRQWEVVNIASNAVKVTAGANVTVTPSGSGGVMTYQIASSAAGGDVFGPASVTDLTIPTWGGTSGDRLTNSGVKIDQFANVYVSSGELRFGTAGITNWAITVNGHWVPTSSNTYDIGAFTLTPRTNYANKFVAKEAVYAPEFTGTAVAGAVSAVTIPATNQTQAVRIQGAHQMSVLVTNIVGLLHKAFASVIEFDANQIHETIVTNRVTGVSSIIYTNISEGQLLTLDMFGEAAGGTSRVITLIPHTGFLALDGNNPGTGPGLNLAFTLTNGNKAEISGKVRKVFGATNIIEYLVNQSKF